ncbi:hypothetical protein WN51_01407 [Melipona quadrifasciata]|uniref:Uncharacterized protein n=1 Tax=Melipona quadrifasciata TaxID=166423 RepID=A0A0M8ZYR1_9HYME|nr:hypothetical protein WN51_01407 [Melipona quadrifasciata]
MKSKQKANAHKLFKAGENKVINVTTKFSERERQSADVAELNAAPERRRKEGVVPEMYRRRNYAAAKKTNRVSFSEEAFKNAGFAGDQANPNFQTVAGGGGYYGMLREGQTYNQQRDITKEQCNTSAIVRSNFLIIEKLLTRVTLALTFENERIVSLIR